MPGEKVLDRHELSVLRGFGRAKDWTTVSIFRSGGGQWMAYARQGLKRKGLLESHPNLRRVWRITPAGRHALSKEDDRHG